VLQEGSGEQPNADSNVTVHYEGSLIDGTVFDSSYKRKQPATFSLSQVIQGWQEALPMMRVGGKWQIFVPADLAYGDRGAGELIKPGATLIFDIELISIN
jgi:FKBP-type peptidyl-prolyl cis-trans isomerase FklB